MKRTKCKDDSWTVQPSNKKRKTDSENLCKSLKRLRLDASSDNGDERERKRAKIVKCEGNSSKNSNTYEQVNKNVMTNTQSFMQSVRLYLQTFLQNWYDPDQPTIDEIADAHWF
jgi:hypothetical protein